MHQLILFYTTTTKQIDIELLASSATIGSLLFFCFLLANKYYMLKVYQPEKKKENRRPYLYYSLFTLCMALLFFRDLIAYLFGKEGGHVIDIIYYLNILQITSPVIFYSIFVYYFLSFPSGSISEPQKKYLYNYLILACSILVLFSFLFFLSVFFIRNQNIVFLVTIISSIIIGGIAVFHVFFHSNSSIYINHILFGSFSVFLGAIFSHFPDIGLTLQFDTTTSPYKIQFNNIVNGNEVSPKRILHLPLQICTLINIWIISRGIHHKEFSKSSNIHGNLIDLDSEVVFDRLSSDEKFEVKRKNIVSIESDSKQIGKPSNKNKEILFYNLYFLDEDGNPSNIKIKKLDRNLLSEKLNNENIFFLLRARNPIVFINKGMVKDIDQENNLVIMKIIKPGENEFLSHTLPKSKDKIKAFSKWLSE